MSESHWGETSLKGPLLSILVAVAFVSGMVGLYFWAPWEEPSETDWLLSYEAWTEGVEASLAGGGGVSGASCERTFEEAVGDPPKERLERAAQAARSGCARLSPDGWRAAQADVVRAVLAAHAAQNPEARPRPRSQFSEIATAIAGTRAAVFCWPAESWAPFAEQYALLRGDEEVWMKGVADVERSRIDLEPGVCGALGRYVRRIRPPALSYENFALAEGLVVLAHQAEHLKDPSASEQEVECYAVQHVRPLLRSGGWGAFLQNEIALHGWDIAYTQLPPQYRTPDCRNGGPLDRNPDSAAWP